MTMIANCREKYTKDAYPYGFRHVDKYEINPYWEGQLKGDNQKEIFGYDHGTDTALNAFCNAEIGDMLKKYAGGKDITEIETLAQEIYSMIEDSEKYTESDFEEVIDKATSSKTKAILAMMVDISSWNEDERNMLITARMDEQCCKEEKDDD